MARAKLWVANWSSRLLQSLRKCARWPRECNKNETDAHLGFRMAKYTVKVMRSGDVLGWAETDDQSMRFAPAIVGSGRQNPDEIDITSLAFTGTALQKLSDPPMLISILNLAPFQFEIIDK